MARQHLFLTLQDGGAAIAREVGIDDAIVAGWSGRDAAAVEKHIAELEALGVRQSDLGPPTPAVPDRKVQLPENTLMFCGTLAARGGVRPTGRFEFEIEDPVLGRSIAHGYSVRILPVLG